MAETKIVLLTFSFVVVAAVLFAGCTQTQAASKCTSFSDQFEKENCLNYMATWYQDPYACYDIKNMTLRESCLSDAVDPKKATKLKVQKNNEDRMVETIVVNDSATQTQTAQPSVETDEITICMNAEGMSKDGCIHKIAIEKLDLKMCDEILSESYRRPCITNIAIGLKKPDQCTLLKITSDQQLCNFYSGG
ncbi:MAG: hypothetical protein WC492_00065 [Candidatus Micrarchaeia archaeon]